MKLIDYMKYFLENHVDLPDSKLKILNDKVEIIDRFFTSNGNLKDNYKKAIPQGSYGHKTIINPVNANDEFDADILVHFKEVEEWEPKDYINNIYNEFKNNGNYKDIVTRRTRCIVVNYKGDFHLDIVPFIKTDEGNYIFNRNDNIKEPTNPEEYKKWLSEKDTITGSKLKKVIRIFKYLRDHKRTFSAKSILINTLLGNVIKEEDSKDVFSDLPTSLLIIIERLNEFLIENEKMPKIQNPVCSDEDFNRHWDQEKYDNFRSKIDFYAKKIRDAYEEVDKKKSIEKWQEVFGDDYPDEIVSNDSLDDGLKSLAQASKPWSC